MYEFLIRDCDENGHPKIEVCTKCKKKIPLSQINVHRRNCYREKL